MNIICYILLYKILQHLSKGGVAKSCKKVFKFGPRRMSTGELNDEMKRGATEISIQPIPSYPLIAQERKKDRQSKMKMQV